MAITQTALTADLSATAKSMTVSSGSGFPSVGTIANPGYLVRIDKEFMLAVAQPATGVITIAMRGYNGTAARDHDILAKVEVSAAPSDFADPSAGNVVSLPPNLPSQQTLGEDYTFTAAEIAAYGNQPRVFQILKATAIAVTLVAPSKAQDGLVLTFTSLTAALHVITATSLLANGATASPYTTATGADTKIGASLTLQAANGLWNVISNVGWTLS
jgi:hypothetical protein